jgi:hypothetical protein
LESQASLVWYCFPALWKYFDCVPSYTIAVSLLEEDQVQRASGWVHGALLAMASRTTESVSPDSGHACNAIARIQTWATEEDWAAHRSTIKKLYLGENKTLKELMGIMKKQHGLKAT